MIPYSELTGNPAICISNREAEIASERLKTSLHLNLEYIDLTRTSEQEIRKFEMTLEGLQSKGYLLGEDHAQPVYRLTDKGKMLRRQILDLQKEIYGVSSEDDSYSKDMIN